MREPRQGGGTAGDKLLFGIISQYLATASTVDRAMSAFPDFTYVYRCNREVGWRHAPIQVCMELRMTARLLLEVALRIMGCWFLLTSVLRLDWVLYALLSGTSDIPNQSTSYYFISSSITLVLQVLLGFGLIYFAPLLAIRFYREEVDIGTTQSRIGPGDLYHIACFGLGIHFLISAAEPLGRLVSAGMEGFSADRLVGVAFTAVVYVAASLILTFGSQRIGKMLTGLRYDPDAIPKQQLSVSFLLGVMVFFAVLLGVLKFISG